MYGNGSGFRVRKLFDCLCFPMGLYSWTDLPFASLFTPSCLLWIILTSTPKNTISEIKKGESKNTNKENELVIGNNLFYCFNNLHAVGRVYATSNIRGTPFTRFGKWSFYVLSCILRLMLLLFFLQLDNSLQKHLFQICQPTILF